MTKREQATRTDNALLELGFSFPELDTLRRIERRLHRWAELECGNSDQWKSWAIERDETSGKPYLCVYPHDGPARRAPAKDLEAGALRRLAKLLAQHPELIHYHQTDPRGCALYLLRKSDIRDGERLASVYTRGVAVCY